MQIQLEQPESANIIRQLEPVAGGFRVTIKERIYDQSLIITPLTLDLWNVETVSALEEANFVPITQLETAAEVVLIGTGTRLQFPSPATYRTLIELGIGVEIMDTPAACRTYNILAGDGRKVAAALIL